MPTRRFTCPCGTAFTRYHAPGKPAPIFCCRPCATDAQRNPHRDPRSWARKPNASLTTAERGYGSMHQAARRVAIRNFHEGQPCARCGHPMYSRDLNLSHLHLDHADDRAGYRGLAHARCNVKAGARVGAQASHRTTTSKTCTVCGRRFRPWTATQSRCSHQCRRGGREAGRERQVAAAERARKHCPTCNGTAWRNGLVDGKHARLCATCSPSRQAASRARADQARAMRAQGAEWQTIATVLGYSNGGAAYNCATYKPRSA